METGFLECVAGPMKTRRDGGAGPWLLFEAAGGIPSQNFSTQKDVSWQFEFCWQTTMRSCGVG